MSGNLIRVKGIGEGAAEKLKEAGISSIDQLVKSRPEELSKIKGIGLTSAKKWIENAKELLNVKALPTSNKPKPKISPKTTRISKPRSATKKTPKIRPKTSTENPSRAASSSTSTRKTQSISRTKNSAASRREPKFADTAEPIPAFLYKRISKKAQTILKMSYTFINRESVKNLETYVKLLNPERIKFDHSYADEKNALLAIDEKVKFIENIILHNKKNESHEYLRNVIIIPIERGNFRNITDRLSEYFGPEEAAIKIFDGLNKKAKKFLLKNATEMANIRDIQKILEQKYPQKVQLYNRRRQKK